jgi:ribosome biogenesis GTPase
VALHAADDGLALAFADVEELATACKFADCGHVTETRLRGAVVGGCR